jgi:hypothetical protein
VSYTSTTTATSLNSCAVVHSSKENALALEMIDILRQFSLVNESRREQFDKI